MLRKRVPLETGRFKKSERGCRNLSYIIISLPTLFRFRDELVPFSFMSKSRLVVPLFVHLHLSLLFLLLLFVVVDDLLLVEDLLALAVADEERRREGDHDEGHPGDAVAEAEAPGPTLT